MEQDDVYQYLLRNIVRRDQRSANYIHLLEVFTRLDQSSSLPEYMDALSEEIDGIGR